jgi:hypothetical protein
VFGIKNVGVSVLAEFCRNTRISAGFLNAQYRFVVNPTGDYTVHFADPDMYVFNAD